MIWYVIGHVVAAAMLVAGGFILGVAWIGDRD